MFPNAYILITRLKESADTTDLGSTKTTSVIIQNNLAVSLLEDTSFKLKNINNFGEAGKTTISMYSLTCNTFFDIVELDTITYLGPIDDAQINLEIGEELQVFNKPYVGNLIPHVKATLKLGAI